MKMRNEIVMIEKFGRIILSLKDDTRGDENDEVTFEYKIQSNGSPDFSK